MLQEAQVSQAKSASQDQLDLLATLDLRGQLAAPVHKVSKVLLVKPALPAKWGQVAPSDLQDRPAARVV